MQLKISCFNKTLFRKNLTRFWPLWGMASFIGVLFPLVMFMELSRGYNVHHMEMREILFATGAYAAPLISLFYAVLCALAVWNYLYNPRSVGLMHTLPIRREGLFLTNFLSGMAMMLIPYVITGAVTILVTAVFGCFDLVGVGAAIAAVLANSIFYFASATAVAFVTGNVFAMPVLYFIFHFLAVIMDFMISSFSSGFLFGVDREYNGVVEWLSPTVYLVSRVRVDSEYESYHTPDGGYYSECVAVTMENWHLLAIYAAVGAVLLAFAWMLYKRRRSESAGDVVAVGWMKPVFLWGVTCCCALVGGQGLYLMFLQNTSYAPIPMAVCMLVAGAIGYYAARMLLAKSLRVFRGSWRGLGAVAVLSAALCLTLEADLLGVERRVPEANQIESVSVYVANNNYSLRPGEDDVLISQLRDLHAAVAADADYIEHFTWVYDDMTIHDVSEYNTLRITYVLRGGVEVYRYYRLPLVRQRMEEAGTYDYLMNAFVNGYEAKAKRLHINDGIYKVESAGIWNIEGVMDTHGNGYDFSSREALAILEAVGKDLDEGTWGMYDFFEYDEGEKLEATMEFSFRYYDEQGRDRYDYISIRLTPQMRNTLKLLVDMGILNQRDLIPLSVKYPERYEKHDELWELYEKYGITEELTSFPDYGMSSSMGIIGGADGPTAIVVGKTVG